jgi:hypothetical protein
MLCAGPSVSQLGCNWDAGDLRLLAMAGGGEKFIQKTYRLPPSVVEFVEALKESRILGHTDSEVVRSLLETAISNLVKDDYIRKYQETLKALKR